MTITSRLVVALLIFLNTVSSGLLAQDRVRIVIEEVQLSVTALDQYGHFDPTLTTDDFLIMENGVRQEIRSVRHIPANIVLLLDVGVEINKGKSLETSRAIARNILAALNLEDRISIMQVSDKVEILQDWTNDFKEAKRILDTKLLSGRHAYLSDGLVAAANQFGELPIGTRHVVLISDGVETAKGRFDRTEALKRLQASNAVVHVISYTAVSRRSLKESRAVLRERTKSTTPDDAVNSLPSDKGYERLRDLHKPGGVTADVDPVRQIRVRDYESELSRADAQLKFLATETGGHFWLPESVEEMVADGVGAARLIDAQYVATYKPKRAVIGSAEGELRFIQVIPRRVGLRVVARRTYFANSNNSISQ